MERLTLNLINEIREKVYIHWLSYKKATRPVKEYGYFPIIAEALNEANGLILDENIF